MITGEIRIATTWAASTSFIPFDAGMVNAHDFRYGGMNNRGAFATTAYVHGFMALSLGDDGVLGVSYSGDTTVYPGRANVVKVRKLKALKAGPNRSGVQVSAQLVYGDRLVFRYVAQGALVRP